MTYPTTMDIDLAIERILMCKYVIRNPTILAEHTILQKTQYIPQFYTPAYLVDFGYVLTETLVHRTVYALNYGPTDVPVRMVQNLKKNGFLDAGFNVQFDKAKLRVGETFPIHIILFAPHEQYPKRRHDLEFTIYLEVIR